MLLVNGLQQDQNHEAEALPSYASMDEFPEKKSKHSDKDTTAYFSVSGKDSQIIRYSEAFFATWKQHDRDK
jgi:hypothetical protein